MAAHLRDCAKLDRELRAIVQTRTIFDPEVRRLRAALRDQCEAALLADLRLSQKHDAEQLLWKAVYYRPIEEFRRRVKAADGELRDKTRLAFHVFLEEAKAFYLALAVKLQQRWGDAGLPTALAAQLLQAMGIELPAALPPASQACDCSASVHRCLVCLGDLCRYQTNALPPAERDWAQCRHFYSLAARVHPDGGNAYNQLAVLASYEGDDLAASYFYIRALAAGTPFPVARENLVTHFEQNRAACAKLGVRGPGGTVPRGQRPASQAAKELRTRCTRLLCTLLTRDDLDAFPAQLSAAMADLDDHLQRLRQQGRKAAEAAAAIEQAPPLLLQLAAAAIFAAHSSASPPASASGQPPSFAVAVQQQRVHSLCLLLLFNLTAKLAAAAAAAAEAAPGGLVSTAAGPLLLPPLHVLLLWLGRAGPNVLLPPQQAQQEAADLAAARQQLWQACTALVCALRAQQDDFPPADAQDAQQAQHASALLLPEDIQLAGFRPLESRLEASSVSNPSGSGTASSGAFAAVHHQEAAAGEAAAAERVRLVLRDSAALARVLAGERSQRLPAGLAAAQEAFIQAALPGEQVEQPQQAGRAEEQPAEKQQAERQQQAEQQQAEQQQAEQEMQEAGELEEEVILYAPPPRPARSPAPAPAAPQQAQQAQQQSTGGTPPTQGMAGMLQAAAAGAARAGEPAGTHATAAAAPVSAAAPAPQVAPAAAAAEGAGPVGMDLESEDALMAQTVEAVAGSVLPEDDRCTSPPLPRLQPTLAHAGGSHTAAQSHPLPAAGPAAGVHAAAPVPEGGVQLPPAFFSLLGAANQPPAAAAQPPSAAGPQLAGQPPIGQVTPELAGPLTTRLQSQPQQAVGLRALLFGGSSGGGQPALQLLPQQAPPLGPPPPLQQQLAVQAASSAAQPALLSSATAADRWAWMGAFGGGSTGAAAASSATHAAPAQQQAAGLPLPIPPGQHGMGLGWQQQQQQQPQQPQR